MVSPTDGMAVELAYVQVYSDGACLGNPGPGGYGAVLLYWTAAGREVRQELAQGYRLTTNNRMELLAVIAALRALKRRCRVEVVSDSQYVVRAMTEGWIQGWQALGWKRKEKGRLVPLLNADLWKQLAALCGQHAVSFQWVRGHTGDALNERADELSVEAAKRPTDALLVDQEYESLQHGNAFPLVGDD